MAKKPADDGRVPVRRAASEGGRRGWGGRRGDREGASDWPPTGGRWAPVRSHPLVIVARAAFQVLKEGDAGTRRPRQPVVPDAHRPVTEVRGQRRRHARAVRPGSHETSSVSVAARKSGHHRRVRTAPQSGRGQQVRRSLPDGRCRGCVSDSDVATASNARRTYSSGRSGSSAGARLRRVRRPQKGGPTESGECFGSTARPGGTAGT